MTDEKEIFICQCYLENDLFKVVQFSTLSKKLTLAIVSPMDVNMMTEEEMKINPPSITCTKLYFEFAGIVEVQQNRVICRYDYSGGE